MKADLEAYRRVSTAGQAVLEAIDHSPLSVVAAAADYTAARHVPAHWHVRSQLMLPQSGTMLVSTPESRWIVPERHALWMPAGVVHEVEMIGPVRLRSAYVRPEVVAMPPGVRVVAATPLLHELLLAATAAPGAPEPRDRLVLDLIAAEIPRLEERPLALPIPADPRLAALCRGFLAAPAAHVSIDGWAARAGMSRRSLTRHFREETGLSLSRWRQQASLFAALPRLAAGEPVTRVAMDLGYDSVAAFSTMVRRMLGQPPRAYAAAGFSAGLRAGRARE